MERRRPIRIAQRGLRALGLDVRRHRLAASFAGRRLSWLLGLEVETVLDCGAHQGNWGLELRQAGYRGSIVSFEPLSESFATLRARAGSDDRWEAHRLALGDRAGRRDMGISGNDRYASSLLPMTAAQTLGAPGSDFIGSEEVEVVRLDDALAGTRLGRALLKADVQGSEAALLDGAAETLEACVLVQLELPLVEAYEGQASCRQLRERMAAEGFVLVDLERVYADVRTGELVEVDGLFVRRDAAAQLGSSMSLRHGPSPAIG